MFITTSLAKGEEDDLRVSFKVPSLMYTMCHRSATMDRLQSWASSEPLSQKGSESATCVLARIHMTS